MSNDDQAVYPAAELFLLKQFMKREGIAVSKALPGSGLTLAQLNSAESPVSMDQFDRLYRNLYRLAGRADFGLALGSALTLSRWGLTATALLSSKTLGDALATADRMKALLRSRFSLSVTLEQDEYRVRVERLQGMSYALNAAYAHEIMLASLQQQIRQLLGRDFRFSSIGVNYPAPAHAREYERVFACPVRFDQPQTTFCIHRELMHAGLPLANPVVKQQAMAAAQAELRRVSIAHRGDIVLRVRSVLEQGEARMGIDAVAVCLNLSARTLRRKLVAQGSSFQTLQDEETLRRASLYLADPQAKVPQVALQCGFRDVASFRSLFRRLTGQSPQQWRQGN